jgi:hypothetical protein
MKSLRAGRGLVLLIAAAVFGVVSGPVAWATGWQTNATLTSVASTNYGGEIVTFTINGQYDNSGGCPAPTAYTIRDAASLHGELAVLMAAFVSGRTVNIYVTGSCDSTGNPSVVGVSIH